MVFGIGYVVGYIIGRHNNKKTIKNTEINTEYIYITKKVPKFACRECGILHDSENDALYCC